MLDYYTWETESSAFSTCELSSDNSVRMSCAPDSMYVYFVPIEDILCTCIIVCTTMLDYYSFNGLFLFFVLHVAILQP